MLDQHQRFAEDLAQVTTVDLVDEQDEVPSIHSSPVAESDEDSVATFEAFRGRPNALHEVFVGVGLVELDHGNAKRVVFTGHDSGQSFGDDRLADPWWPLQDQVLLLVE